MAGGTLPASYILATNLNHGGQSSKSGWFKVFGYGFLIATYFIALFIAASWDGEYNFAIEIAIILVAQSLASAPFLVISRLIDKGGFGEKEKKRPWVHTLPYLLGGSAITLTIATFGSFFTTLFFVYLAPNLYVHSKISRLFVSKKSKAWFTVGFIVLAALFPLGGRILPFHQDFISRIAAMTGDYYAPLLMYVFLLYLTVGILGSISVKAGIIAARTTEQRKHRLSVFFIILLISTAILVKGIYNYESTRISRYEIEVSRKSGNLDRLKIAMAADLHISEKTSRGFIKQFVEKINAIEPDIVLLAGDIFDSNDPSHPRVKFAEAQLATIRSKYGVYAVEGNHDLYKRTFPFGFYDRAKIHLVRDTVIVMDKSFNLVGRKDRRDRTREPLEALLDQTRKTPIILMDHQPYDLHQAYENGVDIQLSGHTHNGQLFPISLIVKSMYELSWGYRKINGSHFFVTCGAQGWGPPVKTGSRSEIMEIVVHFKD